MRRNKEKDSIFRPVTIKKVPETVYEQIRDKILSGQLKPGDRLPPERSMMELFQRSRPPIREALRMLESEGYISTLSGKSGAVINKISTKSLERSISSMLSLGKISDEELISFRTFNDTICVEWAVKRCTQTDIDVLQGILNEHKNVDFCSPETTKHYDILFHKAIAKATYNQAAYIISKSMINLQFNRLLKSFQNMSHKEMVKRNKEICNHHEKLLDAFIKRDLKLAKKLIMENAQTFASLL
jgi:GntR family transcriptional repressor for pyruvate dehydrogenase complex